jgi:hypothetical protein
MTLPPYHSHFDEFSGGSHSTPSQDDIPQRTQQRTQSSALKEAVKCLITLHITASFEELNVAELKAAINGR